MSNPQRLRNTALKDHKFFSTICIFYVVKSLTIKRQKVLHQTLFYIVCDKGLRERDLIFHPNMIDDGGQLHKFHDDKKIVPTKFKQ